MCDPGLPKVLFPGIWIRCFPVLCYTADKERFARRGHAIWHEVSVVERVICEGRHCGRGRGEAVACVIISGAVSGSVRTRRQQGG